MTNQDTNTTAPADMTEAQWVEVFVAHTLKTCGFTHFDDGTSVEAYAREVAPAIYANPYYRAEGPEACADSDMDYWGEE